MDNIQLYFYYFQWQTTPPQTSDRISSQHYSQYIVSLKMLVFQYLSFCSENIKKMLKGIGRKAPVMSMLLLPLMQSKSLLNTNGVSFLVKPCPLLKLRESPCSHNSAFQQLHGTISTVDVRPNCQELIINPILLSPSLNLSLGNIQSEHKNKL